MRPVIGILSNNESISIPDWGVLEHQSLFYKYIEAVNVYANCSAVLIPSSLASRENFEADIFEVIRRLDGIVLPGGSSNLSPELYGSSLPHCGQIDLARDNVAIALVRAAISLNLPILGICRGLQEINVALGGTLMPDIEGRANLQSHRADRSLDFTERYEPSHDVMISMYWKEVLGFSGDDRFSVNSLHNQCIDKLAAPLIAIARTSDGVIEAVSSSNVGTKLLAVQWHPEWNVETCKLNSFVWTWLSKSCRDYCRLKQRK